MASQRTRQALRDEGLSLVEVIRMFPDDATAEAWIENGVWCPHCGSESDGRGAQDQ